MGHSWDSQLSTLINYMGTEPKEAFTSFEDAKESIPSRAGVKFPITSRLSSTSNTPQPINPGCHPRQTSIGQPMLGVDKHGVTTRSSIRSTLLLGVIFFANLLCQRINRGARFFSSLEIVAAETHGIEPGSGQLILFPNQRSRWMTFRFVQLIKDPAVQKHVEFKPEQLKLIDKIPVCEKPAQTGLALLGAGETSIDAGTRKCLNLGSRVSKYGL
jgi:hypothetical protein